MTSVADVRRALAVVAHPDDESFGLGAVLDALARRGAPSALLCFTHGESSTLGKRPESLARIRARELAAAASILGVAGTTLLSYPDGGLGSAPLAGLAAHVRRMIERHRPTHLLVFDTDGVTGHPDHRRATEAALAAAGDLPVLAWAIPDSVATALNAEFGTSFAGRPLAQPGRPLMVDRARQWEAIARHRSQSADNPVLHRRLALQGDHEYLRVLAPTTSGT